MPNNRIIQISDSDTVIYSLARKSSLIDSVSSVKSDDSVHLSIKGNQIQIISKQFQPGVHNMSLKVYCGKQEYYIEDRLFKVSDIIPSTLIPMSVLFLPHDTSSFTQGLVYRDQVLYESTGLLGRSKLSKLDPKTGEILAQVDIDPNLFGEGLAVLNDSLWQLTWKNGKIQVFDFALNMSRQLPYKREGWGLTSKGDLLVASDGSEYIYFLNGTDLTVERELIVYDDKGVVSFINELEFIEGAIWANVLGRDHVIVIDEKTGKVMKRIDFSSLIDRQNYPHAGPLNGIAFNKTDNLIYFTGKNWPFLIVWAPFFAD